MTLSGVRCFVLFTLILKQLVLLCLVSFVFICSVTQTCFCFYMTAVYLLYIALFLDCNVSFLASFVWDNSSKYSSCGTILMFGLIVCKCVKLKL